MCLSERVPCRARPRARAPAARSRRATPPMGASASCARPELGRRRVEARPRLDLHLRRRPPPPRRRRRRRPGRRTDDGPGAAGGIVAASTGECASMCSLRPCQRTSWPDGSTTPFCWRAWSKRSRSPPSSSSRRRTRCACCDETKRRSPQLFSSCDFSPSTAFSRAAPSSDCVMSSRCSRLFSRSSRPFSFRSGCTCVCAITSSCPATSACDRCSPSCSFDRSRSASSCSTSGADSRPSGWWYRKSAASPAAARTARGDGVAADALARDCRTLHIASQNSRQATADLGSPDFARRVGESAEAGATLRLVGGGQPQKGRRSRRVRAAEPSPALPHGALHSLHPPDALRGCTGRRTRRNCPPELHCSRPKFARRAGTRGSGRARRARTDAAHLRGRRRPKLRTAAE